MNRRSPSRDVARLLDATHISRATTHPAPLPLRDPDRPRRWNTGCGTDPGWWKHRERAENPCPDCDAAHKQALDDWAKARAAAVLAEVD